MYKYILLLCLLNTFLVFCILNDILICSLVLILNNIFVYIEWYNWQKQFSDYWVPGIHVHNDGMTLGPKGEPRNSDDRRWCAHFKHEYDQLLMIFFQLRGESSVWPQVGDMSQVLPQFVILVHFSPVISPTRLVKLPVPKKPSIDAKRGGGHIALQNGFPPQGLRLAVVDQTYFWGNCLKQDNQINGDNVYIVI